MGGRMIDERARREAKKALSEARNALAEVEGLRQEILALAAVLAGAVGK